MGPLLRRHKIPADWEIEEGLEPEPRQSPQECLTAYQEAMEDFLDFVTGDDPVGDDLDYILWWRSELELSTQEYPEQVDDALRQRLEELDNRLRQAAPKIVANFPHLHETAEEMGYPREHWWRYLDGVNPV